MTPDAVAIAYATLGLSPGCTLAEAKKTYRVLVKRWHPDQYLADPAGQAEANERLRAINDAFRVVVENLSEPPSSAFEAAPPTPGRPPREPGRPLSRAEIDEIVQAMSSESPVYAVLDGFAIAWRLVLALLLVVWIGGLRSASRFGIVAALLVLAVVYLVRRRKRAQSPAETERGADPFPPSGAA